MDNNLFKTGRNYLRDNVVPIIFTILCIASIGIAGQPLMYVLNETIARLSRNSILILSLIFPILCGMGLNFGIVLGAMAGEIGLILVTHWQLDGIAGIAAALLIATVIAIVLGYLTGKLFNKVKGQEMITGLILGFFAIGIYDLIFLYMLGTVIPMSDPALMLVNTSGQGTSKYVGLSNTINLRDNTKYAVDSLISLKVDKVLLIATIAFFVILISMLAYKRFKEKKRLGDCFHETRKFIIVFAILGIIELLSLVVGSVGAAFSMLSVPVSTGIFIAVVCLLIWTINKTKLGQDIRTVGQDMHIAEVAGINVNRTRIISTILSVIIAAWGQIIFLQNVGCIQTYNSHEQVGTFAVAAILVGGASMKKATFRQVFLGAALFHVLFFITPLAGKALFGNAMIGEYFRVFLCYGVIAISLLLYSFKKD